MSDAGADYILVVDDDEDIRLTLQQILEEEGYPALTAANGEEALDVIRGESRRLRLVLLDLMMPIMDGARFQAKLAEDPGLAAVPVVVISAGATSNQHSGVRAVRYLSKPVDLRTLMGAIRSLVA
jgi:two-component system, chemotaxis family, chemotaxis protein CheY